MMQSGGVRGAIILGMLVVAGLVATLPMRAQTQPRLNLMPWPSSVETGAGQLRIDESFSILPDIHGYRDPRTNGAIDRFLRPVCYQNLPDRLLPPALREANPYNVTRRIDGVVKAVSRE